MLYKCTSIPSVYILYCTHHTPHIHTHYKHTHTDTSTHLRERTVTANTLMKDSNTLDMARSYRLLCWPCRLCSSAMFILMLLAKNKSLSSVSEVMVRLVLAEALLTIL